MPAINRDEIIKNAKLLESAGAPADEIEDYVSKASSELITTFPQPVVPYEPTSLAERTVSGLREFSPFPTSSKELQMPLLSGRRQDIATLPLRPLLGIEKYGSRIKEAGIKPIEKGIDIAVKNIPERTPLPLKVGASGAAELFVKPALRFATPFTPSEFGTLGLPAIAAPFLGSQVAGGSKQLGKYATSKISGIQKETLTAWEKNPQLLESKTIESIAANEIPAIADKFKQIISGLSEKSKGILSKSKYLEDGAVSKSKIIDSVKNVRKELGGVYTSESQSASNALKKISINYKKLKNTISQNNVKNLIEGIDKEINWSKMWKSPETLTATDRAFINLRQRLDSLLKNSNKDYSDLMKPLSQAIEKRSEFFKKFGVERIRDVGEKGTTTKYLPSDITPVRLRNIGKEEKLGTERITRGVADITGEKLSPKIKNALWREEIESATMRVPFTDIKFRSKGFAEKALKILRTPYE